jgi:hypothetical protein
MRRLDRIWPKFLGKRKKSGYFLAWAAFQGWMLMRWDSENAEAMLALAALDHSKLWTAYWNLQRAA